MEENLSPDEECIGWLAEENKKLKEEIKQLKANRAETSSYASPASSGVQTADLDLYKIKIATTIKTIMEEMPLTGDNAEDGRYIHPARWNTLVKILLEEE